MTNPESETTKYLGVMEVPLDEGTMLLKMPHGISDKSANDVREFIELAITVSQRDKIPDVPKMLMSDIMEV